MKINVLPMLKMLWPQLILVAIIYIVVILLPYRNLLTIPLSIVTIILMYKLYNNINHKTKPKPYEYLKTSLITTAWIMFFMVIINWLGAYGIIGFISLIILLVAWRIIKGRKLFLYTTKWGADILHGKREDFDITMLEPEPIKKDFDPILKELINDKQKKEEL